MSVNNTEDINSLLFNPNVGLIGKWEKNSKFGFFVHSSVFPSFRKYLKRVGVTYLWDVWDYGLKVGSKLYDMKLIFLKLTSEDLMHRLIVTAQFTFYWERRSTLFSTLDQYHLLEEFITINNYKSFIISEEVREEVNSINQSIKVVTFNNKVKCDDLIVKFMTFLKTKSINEITKAYHYYVTFALPWLQPNRLRHFQTPLQNKRIFQELQTFLICMRELSYENEPPLDLFGLCSLKLAFCDDINVTPDSRDLDYEINALIKRSLKKMKRLRTYIVNDEFNLEQYSIDQNCASSLYGLAFYYFKYMFQDYFKSVKLVYTMPITNICPDFNQKSAPALSFNTKIHVIQTLKLVEEVNLFKKLKGMPEARFNIDGTNYTEMNLKLFCDIIKYKNVQSIVLDTNYKWSNINKDLYRGDAYATAISIDLIGDNQYKFIEGFISSLANILNSQNIDILVFTALEDYRIFKDLNIRFIGFDKIQITSKMLIELRDCSFQRSYLVFENCSIKDDVTAWKLLNNLRININIITVEENTWQYIFEYISEQLNIPENSEFKFAIPLTVTYRFDENTNREIGLNGLKFTFDEFKTRLEIRSALSGEWLDLYYLVNPPTISIHDHENLYEFYK